MSAPKEVLEIPAETREAVRQAVRRLEKAGESPTVRAVRMIVGKARSHVASVLRVYKAGELDLNLPWGEDLERGGGPGGEAATLEDLLALVREAEGPGDLARVCGLAQELALTGGLSAQQARTVVDLAREQRRALADARAIPPEDPERIYLVSKDGALLVEAFERIVADERRERVLELVHEILEEDVEALPAVDPVGAL